MKYFVIFLVLIGLSGTVFAQYTGGVEFYHLPLTVDSKQYSVLAQSNTNYFTDVAYDREAHSLIFSTSVSEDFIDTYTITLNEQTFSELLATDYAKTPDSVLILINGIEQPYRIFKDNGIISWRFYVPITSDEVELISSTPRFDTGVYKFDKIPNGSPKIYPPLKQNHVGIVTENIQCKDDFILLQKYDYSPACVTESTKQKLTERGWTTKNSSISKTSTNCMTIKQSKETAPFFKIPTYLPEGYSYVCSQSGTPTESYIVYHNQEILNWNIPELVSSGAIFIYQIDERSMLDDKKYQTIGTPEQRIQETYDDVIKNNPSLNPQLITINGMMAYAVDSCSDCGMQIANFTDGTFIQKSTSTETKIKFIDENGINYMLETTLPLDELILVAESLR
ncbi:MAG: hypothetical protein ACW9W3_05740 [Candidatus Nitrosopumilus sp. bin_68KS]